MVNLTQLVMMNQSITSSQYDQGLGPGSCGLATFYQPFNLSPSLDMIAFITTSSSNHWDKWSVEVVLGGGGGTMGTRGQPGLRGWMMAPPDVLSGSDPTAPGSYKATCMDRIGLGTEGSIGWRKAALSHLISPFTRHLSQPLLPRKVPLMGHHDQSNHSW